MIVISVKTSKRVLGQILLVSSKGIFIAISKEIRRRMSRGIPQESLEVFLLKSLKKSLLEFQMKFLEKSTEEFLKKVLGRYLEQSLEHELAVSSGA